MSQEYPLVLTGTHWYPTIMSIVVNWNETPKTKIKSMTKKSNDKTFIVANINSLNDMFSLVKYIVFIY